MVQTLNNMEELRNSLFGRPSPRHGLKLLFWFANDYIVIKNDNQMVANYNPKEGDFGFHHFQNRRECENNVCKRLLPFSKYPFYDVGNLYLPTSKSLPKYVRKSNTGAKNDRNMDRLIISMRSDRIVDKVYVTQHEDQKSFDPVNTYCISRELVMIICGHSLSNFLEQAGYNTHEQNFIIDQGIAPGSLGKPGLIWKVDAELHPELNPELHQASGKATVPYCNQASGKATVPYCNQASGKATVPYCNQASG
ncbi:uncharacterized protein LOC135570995 [Oncorhynchus nerka]|uniref:uncharacterized protein LOC135570995 n=1 Tax=Oncorhynchus nerka TaxID=8023 RepID=UPI0031B8B146